VQSGLDSIMQEDGVEHDTRRRIQTERDVRDTQDNEAARQLSLDALDPFDSFERVAAILFDAGRDGKSQRVEENIVRRNVVFRGRLLVSAPRNLKLSFGCARHALLVNRADDDARTVAFAQFENFGET